MPEFNDDEGQGGGAAVRLAAIDVGSNALRFTVVEVAGSRTPRTLEQRRAAIRLGQDGVATGTISARAMDDAVQALASFSRRMADLGVEHYRAVATSAVRESRNGTELIARVRNEAGLTLEAITGAEEARLVHLAVLGRLDLGAHTWLLADVGGGSVEVSAVDRRGVQAMESHGVGAVRLLEGGAGAGQEPERLRRRLDEYAEALRGSPVLRPHLAGFIATGGNVEALAQLAGAAPDEWGVSTLAVLDLRGLIVRLAALSVAARVRQLGLGEDRADVILPAAMLYERIAQLAGVEDIVVPNVGVRDGLVRDLLCRYLPGGRGADA